VTSDATQARAPALVTGATGFLGGALVARLLADGAHVRALVRDPARAQQLAGVGVVTVVGDVTDPGALDAAVDGAATVYHLAGKLLQPGVRAEEYHRTHVDGTALLLERCAAERGLARFVHCSTTGVLGVTGERAADEESPLGPTNAYERTKAIAEGAVQAASEQGLPTVIARPGLVYGPGDLHLAGFFRAVLRRQFRPIGPHQVWLHPIFIDDMTEALVRCGRSPAAIGECFHIAGRRPVTLEELAAAIADAGGTALPRRHIPRPAARALACVGDLLPGRLKGAAPLTRSRLDFLTHSRVYDVTKAERLLGFTAATDLRSGVREAVEWYREHDYLPSPARVS
jgi:nucleoside-diphosphate-sugar epimerase